jgi:hypothetical protein
MNSNNYETLQLQIIDDQHKFNASLKDNIDPMKYLDIFSDHLFHLKKFNFEEDIGRKIHESDISVVSNTRKLFKHLPMTSAPVPSFEVILKFNKFGELLRVKEFIDIPYQNEIHELLRVSRETITVNNNKTRLDRIQCAALILRALIYNDVENLEFKEMMNEIESPLIKEKFKCILFYLIQIFKMMKRYDPILDTPISFFFYKAHEIEMDSDRMIDIDKVSIRQFNTYNRQLMSDGEYVINYYSNRIGEHVLYDVGTYESLWFMKCPELYALLHFDLQNEPFAVRHVKQYNLLNNMSYNSTRADTIVDEVLPVLNFAMFHVSDNTSLYRFEDIIDPSFLIDHSIKYLLPIVYGEQNDLNKSLTFNGGPYHVLNNQGFQFFIELMICLSENSNYVFCASNAVQKEELNRALNLIQNYTIEDLFDRLQKYDLNTSPEINLK